MKHLNDINISRQLDPDNLSAAGPRETCACREMLLEQFNDVLHLFGVLVMNRAQMVVIAAILQKLGNCQ